jgi:hypothetical protein
MKLRSYKNEISAIKERNILIDEIIQNIEDLDESELLKNIHFEFQEIREAEPLFRFENLFIAYSWDRELYAARARKLGENFLMILSPVFIKNLYKSFNRNEEVLSFLLKYVKTEKGKTFLKNDGLTWIINRALFYHEHAHFIQFRNDDVNGLIDFSSQKQKFNELNHFKEIDADVYSAYSVASHILSNLFPKDDKKINLREVAELLVLTFSAIFALVISISKDIKAFYTKERPHPHPIFRALSSSNSLYEYFEIFANQNLGEYELKEDKFWEISIGISQSIIEILYPESVNVKLKDIFSHNYDQIVEYNKILNQGIRSLDSSAILSRNLVIRKQKKTSR